MANANLTKKALASALRDLMEEHAFEKINVSQICEKCDMNRKSFYYHFRDKYDLVNWIFDTDFIALVKEAPDNEWDFMERLCFYFYENRSFYRKALNFKGQNSFSEHLRDFLHPLLLDHLRELVGKDDIHPICADFFADALCCAIERWLLRKDCMPPEQFVDIMKMLVESTALAVCKKMDTMPS